MELKSQPPKRNTVRERQDVSNWHTVIVHIKGRDFAIYKNKKEKNKNTEKTKNKERMKNATGPSYVPHLLGLPAVHWQVTFRALDIPKVLSLARTPTIPATVTNPLVRCF
jgi:hypothetical protein